MNTDYKDYGFSAFVEKNPEWISTMSIKEIAMYISGYPASGKIIN